MRPTSNLWQYVRELYNGRFEPENIVPLARLVWRAILMLAAIGTVVVIAYAVAVFSNVLLRLGSTGGASAVPPVVLDRNTLDQSVLLIESRGSMPTTLPAGNVLPAAPSTPSASGQPAPADHVVAPGK